MQHLHCSKQSLGHRRYSHDLRGMCPKGQFVLGSRQFLHWSSKWDVRNCWSSLTLAGNALARRGPDGLRWRGDAGCFGYLPGQWSTHEIRPESIGLHYIRMETRVRPRSQTNMPVLTDCQARRTLSASLPLLQQSISISRPRHSPVSRHHMRTGHRLLLLDVNHMAL